MFCNAARIAYNLVFFLLEIPTSDLRCRELKATTCTVNSSCVFYKGQMAILFYKKKSRISLCATFTCIFFHNFLKKMISFSKLQKRQITNVQITIFTKPMRDQTSSLTSCMSFFSAEKTFISLTSCTHVVYREAPQLESP